MNETDALILNFSEKHNDYRAAMGGKGANLYEMVQTGFPIPPGFCLTTESFNQFILSNPKMDQYYKDLSRLDPADLDQVRDMAQAIRSSLEETPIPGAIIEQVRAFWQKLGSQRAYAVRSSATAEDLPDASFAGQQDTYLNVLGETNILNAIRRCWASLFTDRSIIYRCENGFEHQDVQLAVVVQAMVPSDKSGVLFTADPVTGHRHTLGIDASFGLGEALVNGLVSPDTYKVDKKNLKILSRQISEKNLAIFPEPGGGTRQENLSETEKKEKVLTDEQILSLAHLGIKTEKFYGSPQDIEWAIHDDQIYLLQSRPITTLFPIEGLKPADTSLHVYFCLGHQQMMTAAMSPLSISTIKQIFTFNQSGNQQIDAVFRQNAGRIFVDMTRALRHPLLRIVVYNAITRFDPLAAQSMKLAMKRPEFTYHPRKMMFSWSTVRIVKKYLGHVIYILRYQNLDGFLEKTNKLITDKLHEIATQLNSTEPGRKLIVSIMDILRSLYKIVLNWIFHFVSAEAAKLILGQLSRRWMKPADIDALSLGLRGNKITEMNRALGDLADLARVSPELCLLFGNLEDSSESWFEQARKTTDSALFFRGFDDFIHDYGARGPSEIDIESDRWYEEPLPLLQVIAGFLKKDRGSHIVQHNRQVELREAAVEKLRLGFKKNPVWAVKRRICDRLVYVIEKISMLREHHKFFVIQCQRVIKERLKITASELVSMKKISEPDDIWYVSWEELLAMWDAYSPDLRALISKRKSDLMRFNKMNPPAVITSDGESPVVKYSAYDLPQNALIGNPVSGGVLEAKVRIIHNPQKEMLNPGEILVAAFTDPGWTPLFINAGGLILEIGGVMNHGSVVAREYGIPAVVGVHGATKVLQTGQRVRIDGSKGIIEILDHQ